VAVRSLHIPDFVTEIASERPTVLAGAAISYPPPSDLPLARDLIDAFQAALAADDEVGRLFGELQPDPLATLTSPELIYNAVADYSCDLVGKLFCEALATDSPNLNHWIVSRLLADGHSRRVITTNFDPLIETLLGDVQYSLRLADQEPQGGRELWKVHGDLGGRMAIALNDVVLIGFSVMPLLLREALTGKTLLVAGYSGNDPHIMRAIMDARPARVWWIVRAGDSPKILEPLSRVVQDVAAVEGDLGSAGPSNPLAALWQQLSRDPIPNWLLPTKRLDRQLPVRLGHLIAGLQSDQKGLVLHSLLRRSGAEMTSRYRELLGQYLQDRMELHGVPRYSPGRTLDALAFYEAYFMPSMFGRWWALEHHRIAPDDTDRHLPHDPVGFRPNDAKILLEMGIEKVFHGNLEGAKPILEAARRSAQAAGVTDVRLKASEALSWAHMLLGAMPSSDREHRIYEEEAATVRRDLVEIQNGPPSSRHDSLLQGFDPRDGPEIYRTLSIDHRLRPHVSALRLVTRVRHYGRPDLALRLLDDHVCDRLPPNAYAHALRAFGDLERARCLILLANPSEAAEALDAAREAITGMGDRDYNTVGIFHHLTVPCLVKLGLTGLAFKSTLWSREAWDLDR
jgi:hypothetical protein